MSVHEMLKILKIIYAPHKAFKEIAQNKKFIGPLIVMLLFILAGVGSFYVRTTKLYFQQTTPSTLDVNNPDLWTDNSTTWSSNANVTSNSNDLLFAQNSIQFSIENDNLVWMKLNNTGSIDCSPTGSYRNFTFSIKWIHPNAIEPQKINLSLFSGNQNDYFFCDLEEPRNPTRNNAWSNVTVPLGSGASQWLSTGSAGTWSNITGLRIELSWGSPVVSNLTVRIDKMFFRSENFESTSAIVSDNISLYVLNFAFIFALYWMIASVVFFFIARLFSVKADLKIFMVIAGYALTTMVVMWLVFAAFYLSIPPIHVSLDSVNPLFVYNVTRYFVYYAPIVFLIWSMILSGFGMRDALQLSMKKSIVIAAIGFGVCYLLLPIG